MTTFIALVRVFLTGTYRIDKDKKKQRLAMYIGMIFGFAPIIIFASLAIGAGGYYIAANNLPIGADFLSVILIFSVLIVFFFGLTAFLQVVFFNKDAEFLLTLPVSPVKLFLSKMTMVYISEAATAAAVSVPSMLAFGIGTALGGAQISALYFVMIPVTAVILPMLPLFLIALLSFPIMYVVSFFKNKLILSLVGGLLLFAGFFAVYFIGISSFSSGMAAVGEENGIQIITDMLIRITSVGKNLYPLKFLANFLLLENTFLNLLYFILSFAVLALAAYFIGSAMYFRSVRGQLDSGKQTDKKVDLGRVSGSIEREVILKEVKMLARDTGFAFQSFMSVVLTPVVIAFYSYMFSGGMSGMEEAGDFAGGGFLIISISMMMIFMLICGANYTAHAAFTREGKHFYMNKFLPIPYETVFNAKLKFASAVSLVGIAVSAVVLAVTLTMSGENPFSAVLNSVLMCGATGVVAYSLNKFGMTRDLKRPKLNWSNVQEALKNNTYAMLPMLIAGGGGMFVMIVGMTLMGLNTAGFLDKTVAYVVFWAVTYLVAVLIFVLFGMKKFENINDLFERVEP
jgi:ABC-2 type transport system permease protein